MGFLEDIKSKRSFIEGSQTNLPIGGSNENLAEIIKTFIDPINRRQFSILGEREKGIAAILDAYSYATDESDVDGFLDQLVQNIFILSASVEGKRSGQIQNVCVGQMNREYALQLAQIRSGQDNKELKDVV